jgi:hypothetical protein
MREEAPVAIFHPLFTGAEHEMVHIVGVGSPLHEVFAARAHLPDLRDEVVAVFGPRPEDSAIVVGQRADPLGTREAPAAIDVLIRRTRLGETSNMYLRVVEGTRDEVVRKLPVLLPLVDERAPFVVDESPRRAPYSSVSLEEEASR